MKKLTLMLILSTLAAPLAGANDTQISSSPKAHICESGEDRRIIEIKPRDGGGCRVMYTRDGNAKEVGSAAYQKDVCDQISEKIIKRLQDSQFQCT